jgi:hypothetical protein
MQPWFAIRFYRLRIVCFLHSIHASFSGASLSALKAVNSTALNLPSSKQRPVTGDSYGG